MLENFLRVSFTQFLRQAVFQKTATVISAFELRDCLI